MTCIVGLVENQNVYMAGDSAGTNANADLTLLTTPKVFINGPFLIGHATSFRMGQLLRYKLKVPERRSDEEVTEFLVCTFIEAVRRCFKENDFYKFVDASYQGGNFLVGYQGRLFRVDKEFQLIESAARYDACGSGGPYALGSLRNSFGSPTARLHQALETAAQFNAGVAAPFSFVMLPANRLEQV